MSRVRLAYALALLGILITTGGCAESATAPEATLREGAVAEAKSPTPTEPTDPITDPDDAVTIQADGYIAGGGRAEQP